MENRLKYRLGLDLGTNSLGWCTIALNESLAPEQIHDAGVRIFHSGRDEKTKQSLAEARRLARGARRRRDRYINRRDSLLNFLTVVGLMPKDSLSRHEIAKLDPYKLRFESLERPLHPHELGRVLFSLNQRRGFKSGRKSINSNEDKVAIEDSMKLMNSITESSSRTLGEHLWKCHQTTNRHEIEKNIQKVFSVRSKPGISGLYPLRDMYEKEFDIIQQKQDGSHSLSSVQWGKIRKIIFYQRPLKPQEVGLCQLYYDKGFNRASSALPSAQKFRAWQEINNLRITLADRTKRTLTDEERVRLFKALSLNKTVSFTGKKGVSTILELPLDTKFNLDGGKRDKLEGITTSILMRKNELFGETWDRLSDKEQDSIIDFLLPQVVSIREGDSHEIKDNSPMAIQYRALTDWDLSAEQACELSKFDIDNFEQGMSRFSIQALQELVKKMATGLRYDEAYKELGFHHSYRPIDHIIDQLPYYGQVIPECIVNSGKKRSNPDERKTGVIGNPTVHIGLNQLRHVVNSLIKKYGKPHEIILEIARDLKMNSDQKKEYENRQSREKKLNGEIAQELINIESEHAIKVQNNYGNRLKYKLWQELQSSNGIAMCPFSGRSISCAQLFTHEIQIEHILPRALTMDDSPSNKTLCFHTANQYKGRRSPYEAFGQSRDGYSYEDILNRVSSFPRNKKWRFEPDAMNRFEDERGFIDSQLHDTQYLSRISMKYLKHICESVRVSPGRLTAKIRHQWGLNTLLNDINGEDVGSSDPQLDLNKKPKNRDDHRHHALDALIVGLIDHKIVEVASRSSALNLQDEIEFKPPIPKEFLRNQAKTILSRIIISHRPDHGKGGPLHEGTNYGPFDEKTISNQWEKDRFDEQYNVVYRKSLESLSSEEVAVIRCQKIRTELLNRLQGLTSKGKNKEMEDKIKKILSDYSSEFGIKKVRILKKEASAIPIEHSQVNITHRKLVAPGNIHHVQFWKLPDGTIKGVGVSLFEVNKPTNKRTPTRPHPAAKLVMKLHKGDVISITHKGKPITAIIKSLRPSSKQIGFWEQTVTKQSIPETFMFGDILKKGIRKLNVTPIGVI